MLTLVLLCSTPPLEVGHYYCGSSGVLRSGLGFLEHTVPYGLTSCVSSRWSSPPILSPAHSIPLLAVSISPRCVRPNLLPLSHLRELILVIDAPLLLLDHRLLQGREPASLHARLPAHWLPYPRHSRNDSWKLKNESEDDSSLLVSSREKLFIPDCAIGIFSQLI